MATIDRRTLLKLGSGASALAALGVPTEALAQATYGGVLSIGYPADVPTWDPNARALAAVQSLYKIIYDQPLQQHPDATVMPALVTKWGFTNPRTLALEFRDDVTFHDGSRMTAADFRYSLFERQQKPVIAGGRKLDTSFIWRRLTDIEVNSPTQALMHFSEPMPSAIAWLYFFCNYVVPKAYIEAVGIEAFAKTPIGTGPYKLIEYQPAARFVLEANAAYWGPKPAIPRLTIEIIRDPIARVMALEAGRIDVAIDVPIRETERLGKLPGIASSVDPTTDIILLQITRNGGFVDDRARLAAHHAIDKAAISKALYGGKALPIAVPAAHGTAGYPETFSFPYSVDTARNLLKELGFSVARPLEIKFASPSGIFPNDIDLARTLVEMWNRVGIKAELEVIETSSYQERLRAGTLPEATLWTWGNSSGDPEFYAGYLLDPKSIFSAFKSDEMTPRIAPLLQEIDPTTRIRGYRELLQFAATRGFTIPLLQSVKTIANRADVSIVKYANGHVLPQTYSMKRA